MNRLNRYQEINDHIVIGLNSGTSLDGIDAVCLLVQGSGPQTTFRVLAVHELPFEAEFSRHLRGMLEWRTADLARTARDLGERFADAALQAATAAGVKREEIDLIGCHGLTVFHQPPSPGHRTGFSLQIGDPSILARHTGALVVTDFRSADLAAGGQGAPLMPYLDWLMFRDQPGTVLLNLGGIANLTLVAENLQDVRAFDTGPANLLLNYFARKLSGGNQEFDVDGLGAAAGRVRDDVLQQLLTHPYFQCPAPKSTGRELFGEAFAADLEKRHINVSPEDFLATLCVFIARHVQFALAVTLGRPKVQRVIVSGGGIHNRTLMKALSEALSPIPLDAGTALGFDPDAKEAVLFGVLAHLRLYDQPTNVPSATGAGHHVLQGRINWE